MPPSFEVPEEDTSPTRRGCTREDNTEETKGAEERTQPKHLPLLDDDPPHLPPRARGTKAMGDSAAAAAPPSRFGRICVFCGSNSGNRAVFGDAALELGQELVTRGIDLVYGGGSIGLMGLIAQTVLDGGCRVLGVIPRALMPLEISGASVGEVKIVSDMHERKAEMARQSDAFIALPGGYGTMEELLEMITWSQLGIHDKPVGLLNVDGYYDPLLALFDKGAAEGFIKSDCRQIIVSAPTARELLTKMEQYTRSHREVTSRTSWEVTELGYGKEAEES